MNSLIFLNTLLVVKSFSTHRLNNSELTSMYQNHDSIYGGFFTFNSPVCDCYEKKLALRYLSVGHRCVEINYDYSTIERYELCDTKYEIITFTPHTYIDTSLTLYPERPPPGHARSFTFLPYETVRCSDFNFENTNISTIQVTSSRTNAICKRENGIFVKDYTFDKNENYYVQYTVNSVPYINATLPSFSHFNVTFTKDVKLNENTYKSYKHLPITYETTCNSLFGTGNNTGIKVHIDNTFDVNTVRPCADIADSQANGLTLVECDQYAMMHLGELVSRIV